MRWAWSASAGLDRGGRQVRGPGSGVEHADEAPEAEHPLQRLRAVARRCVHPPAELAFAEAHLPRDVFGARRGVAQQGGGPRYRVVGSGVGDEQAGDVDRPRGRLGRRQAGGQPPGGRRQQAGEGDALVADLAERQAEAVPPADGRNRTPTMTVPALVTVRTGPVSGPAT